MSERSFTEQDTSTVQPRPHPGYMTALPTRPFSHAIQVGTLCDATPVWWQSCLPARMPRTIMRAALRKETVAACPFGSAPFAWGLTLAFSRHLAHLRDGRPVGPLTTSPTPPATPEGAVRLPHLVHTRTRNGEADLTVWEVLPRPEAEDWLGGPLPDTYFFEQHLPKLLNLKHRWRRGDLWPDTDPHHNVAALLEAGRYLSIRLIYQHPNLFQQLITEQDHR